MLSLATLSEVLCQRSLPSLTSVTHGQVFFSEFISVNCFHLNNCLRDCFPGNLIYVSWCKSWSKKADAEMKFLESKHLLASWQRQPHHWWYMGYWESLICSNDTMIKISMIINWKGIQLGGMEQWLVKFFWSQSFEKSRRTNNYDCEMG